MKKRLLSCLLALTFVLASAVIAFPAFAADVVTDAEFVAPEILIPEYLPLPDNDTLTNNEEFYLAEGTRWQQKVTADFMAENFKSRGTYNYQKYITVHNTGAYPASSTALANHNYGKNTDVEVSWHYTCGNDGIFQMIPLNEKGWHAGGNYWGTTDVATKIEMGWVQDASNSSAVGIETATPGFPAEQTSAGELWDSVEMYEWYANTFDSTATYLAELVAYICLKLNFNPYTQVVQHYSSAAKNCPIQMRYVFGSGGKKFDFYGTYFKVFLDRMYDYYEAMGGTYVETDTVKNTYYNPSSKVYNKGAYAIPAEISVYRAANTATGKVGTIAKDSTAYVEQTSWNWGKVTLADGTKGWIDISALTYKGAGYALGSYRTADGTIIDVTAIDGTTATYEGGTADVTTLTKVYKVTVENDDTFGAEPKYYAVGDTFEVTANAPEGVFLFDIWEVTYGGASIADRNATTTTVTVIASDVVIKASYRDKYDLAVTSGTGSGRYANGETVNISARNMPGKAFVKWVIDEGEGTFADATAATTAFTTSNKDTEIRATYEDMGELDVSHLTNYALGKKYTEVWKGSSTEISYYGVSKDENLTKLTDGVIATAGFANNPLNFVGFQGTGGKAEITIDLGKAEVISNVVLRDASAHGTSFQGIQDGSLKVSYSDDGENFTEVTGFTDTIYFSTPGGEKDTSLETHLGTFDEVKARYFKVDYNSKAYVIAVTEIEVLGRKIDGGTDDPIYALGDTNSDGKVDNLDATVVLKYDAGIVDEIANADVNKDDKVNNLDATVILKYDAGIIDEI